MKEIKGESSKIRETEEQRKYLFISNQTKQNKTKQNQTKPNQIKLVNETNNLNDKIKNKIKQ